jgi:hypothetical protein
MIDSILDSMKKVLNIPSDHHEFDDEIIMHINSVFSTLHQLGVGPVQGFEITDNTALWSTFLGGNLPQNNVRLYMTMRLRMAFDPPTTGYHVDAMQSQIKEMEWRINVQRESIAWVDPDPSPDVEILDGGTP